MLIFPSNYGSRWHLYWVLVLIWSTVTCSSSESSVKNDCRSNKQEIKWKTSRPWQQQVQREALEEVNEYYLCNSQSLQDAKKDAFEFLKANVMGFDKAKLETLGFGDTSNAPDGLGLGLIGPTIDLALKAKMQYPWADELPKEMFYEYVLNYANLNEGRSNWRPLFWDILNPLIAEQQQHHKETLNPNDVVHLVNQRLWSSFPGPNTIYFKHGLTPLIFDPMSVLAFGYASCTGLAVFFVNALRTAGIAARVVGTPAWNSNPDIGNHNWVEVYNHSGKEWVFLEPSPNLTNVDDLHTKPCSKWFCDPGRFPTKENITKVYSARLVFSSSSTPHYPMAWETDCKDVPGEDRTEYYQRVCSQC